MSEGCCHQSQLREEDKHNQNPKQSKHQSPKIPKPPPPVTRKSSGKVYKAREDSPTQPTHIMRAWETHACLTPLPLPHFSLIGM